MRNQVNAFLAQTLRPGPAFQTLATPLAYSLTCEITVDVEPHSTPPTEIDFEPQKPSDRPAMLTSKEPPRDKPSSSSV